MSEELCPEGAVAALGPAAGPIDIPHAGKTWRLGHPDQRAKAELEKLVVALAEDNLAASKEVVSAARYAALEKRLDDHMLARRWQTWGDLWAQTVNGPDGFTLFLLSLLRPHHEGATLTDARALWLSANRRCRGALVMVLPGFFDLLAADLPAEEGDRREAARKMAVEVLANLQQPMLTDSPSTTPSL